jgi:hypothetical protein
LQPNKIIHSTIERFHKEGMKIPVWMVIKHTTITKA